MTSIFNLILKKNVQLERPYILIVISGYNKASDIFQRKLIHLKKCINYLKAKSNYRYLDLRLV